MSNLHAILIVVVMSLVTILLRFLPFVVFGNKETPKVIQYLGNVLPFAIMGMLVVFCLKSVSFVSAPFGLPEVIACLVVIIMHVMKRNTLWSIISGTVVYMILVQMVF